MNDIYTLHRGRTPLLLSLPHAGTRIPPAIAQKLQPRALQTEDTDWHLDKLYAFATALGALGTGIAYVLFTSVIRAVGATMQSPVAARTPP